MILKWFRSLLLLPVSLLLSHFTCAESLLRAPYILKSLLLFQKIYLFLLKVRCRSTYRPKRLFHHHHIVLRKFRNFSKECFPFQFPVSSLSLKVIKQLLTHFSHLSAPSICASVYSGKEIEFKCSENL